MLPRVHRLAHRKDFARVYSRGRQFRSPLVGLYALPQVSGEPRFGISVSKKVGGAVERNLVKRRLREICRKVLKERIPSCDFILVARQAALEADFEHLSRTVEQLVRRAVKEGQPRAGAPGSK